MRLYNAMEVNTIANHSGLYNTPDGALPILDQNLKPSNGSVQEHSHRSDMGNVMAPDSGLLCNGSAVEYKSMNALNGEYCGLGTQIPIEYADIFEILQAEILATEAREIEVIQNGFLITDDGEKHDSKSRETEKETWLVDEHKVLGSIESSKSHSIASRPSDLALAQDDAEERSCQVDETTSGSFSKPAQPIEANCTADLDRVRADTHETDSERGAVDPSGNGNEQIGRLINDHQNNVEGIEPDKASADPSDNKYALSLHHLDNKRAAEFRDAEGIDVEKGDRDSSENAHSQFESLIAHSRDSDASGLLDEGNADPLVSNEGEAGDRCLQTAEAMSAGRLEDNKSDEEGQQHEAAEIAQHHLKTEDAGNNGLSNVRVIEVSGDTEEIGINKGNAKVLDVGKGEDGEGRLQTDKHSECLEDEDHMSTAFSGPIAFSGMLSYSGMISYSGQIPFSGNLSLHSDSSASTRSFAFPILASDWNNSPTKIGPPDSRFLRRRRRWRPCFCCRRPTTLFD